MEFYLPIKYLYNEHRIVDAGLMDAICKEFNTSWDHFPEYIQNEEEFINLFERACPEGSQHVSDGILNVDIYDYYDFYFYNIPNYCIDHNIPINMIEEPEYANEQTTLAFIRPNEEKNEVAVDECHRPLTPIEKIMSMINEADEEKSDTEIMIEISDYLERINPHSNLNSLANWV